MEVRGLRVGALLVPLGVSLVPISVLVWYGLVRIPEREAYLNERNHRLLMTLGGEIKKKVDSFDGALDNAAASFDTNDERQFQVLVQQFSTELSIARMVHETPKATAGSDVVSTVLAMASDPPRVTIEQDEGRSYLYLGAALQLRNQERVWVAARADVDRIVRRRLEARSEFDAIYLTTQLGEVIAQRSPVGVALSRIDSVLRSESDAAAARTPNQQPSFASMSEFSNMAPVTIGEVAYKLYLQPVPLSLLGAASDTRAMGGERHPAQWVLCGLVRADRFRAESSALSYTTLLWFSAALASMTLAIPFLKLRALRPRERLQAGDAGRVTIATFAGIGLVTFGVLDVLVFGSSFERLVDSRLSAVSTQIQRNLTDEVTSIRRQTAQFDRRAEPTLQQVTRELGGASSPALVVRISGRSAAVSCDPQDACDRGILENPATHADSAGAYPFFYLVSWIGDDGWQRMKWTPGHADGMTPFINIKRQRLPYYSAVERAWRHAADGGDQVAEGVSVLQSPNIGEPLTVFWLAQKGRSESFATFGPISLDQPMLPHGVAVAVVDRDGQTLFHSDAARRLQENFFKECRDNSDLRGAVAAAYEETLSVDCTGQPMRLHVAPLVLEGLQNPHWSLIVFQPAAIADTVNLETLTLAASMFALYGIVLGIAALLLRAFAPDRWTKWFWPDPRKRRAYVVAAAANGAIVVVFLAARPLAPIVYPTGVVQSPITIDVAANLQAIAGGNGAMFAKVGDSITASTSFLDCFTGAVDLGAHGDLAPSITAFHDAFARTSVAAVGGWTAADPLAGSPCPLDAEVQTIDPRFAVVMLGTNDDRYGRTLDDYGTDLWTIVDRLRARGVVPILSTIPAIHGDPGSDARVPLFDGVVRALAQGRMLPLVDFHLALSALPDEGIGSDGIHPTVSPDGACVLTSAGLAYGYNMRNLVTLEALDRVRRATAGQALDATAPRRIGSGRHGDPVRAALPIADLADTRTGDSAIACGGTSGRGLVYRVDLAQPATLDAYVVDRDPVDVDVSIVQGGCLAHGDASASAAVAAGTVYIVVASRTSATEGEYLLVAQAR